LKAGCKASLVDLFEGRRQLILYHFMFAPTVDGWPEAGCPGCSFFVDQISHLAICTLAIPLCFGEPRTVDQSQRYKKRLG